MTLAEGFAKNEIFIDFSADIHYGSGQVFVCFPCRFPTVTFMLMATNGLSGISDRIRKEQGYAPMHAMDEYTDDTCDSDGWYDYYVEINGYAGNHMGSCIEFCVVNGSSMDDGELYTIDLTADEQKAVYDRLDEQCRKHLGKSCGELLEESRKEMEDNG